MKGSRTRLRKVLPEREREEAAVPEAIERLISRGPPAGSGIPFEAWRSWHRYGSVAGFARPRQAVKPNAASRRAEGAGLTAKARTERSSMSPQCASSSDTVREIKYQILQL